MPVFASPTALPGDGVLCTMPHIIHLRLIFHMNPLILLQLSVLLLDAILCNDKHLQTVTDLDMSLCCA